MNAWDHYQFQEARAQKIGVLRLRKCLPDDIPAWADRALRPFHAIVSLFAAMAQAGTGPEGRGWDVEDTIALLRHVIRYHVERQPPPTGQERAPAGEREGNDGELLDHIRLLLPLAKGYADQHSSVKVNYEIIESAEEALIAAAPAKAEPAPEVGQLIEGTAPGRPVPHHGSGPDDV